MTGRLYLERRALLGSVANVAGVLAILLQNLVLVPVLLHCWTTNNYGVWITLTAAQTLLFTINYGQEAYVGYEAARMLNRDRDAIPDLIGAAMMLGVILCFLEVFLIVGLGLTHFTRLFGSGSGLTDGWRPLAIMVGCWAGFGSSANILIRVGYALGFYSRFTLYSVLFRMIVTLAIGVTASFGGGVWGVAVAYGLTTMITQAFLAALALRTLWVYQVGICRPRLAVMILILRRSAVISATSLLDAFSENGLLTIISSVLSPRIVPSFSTLRTITNTARQGVGIIMNPLDPDMIRYHANTEFSKLSEVFGVCWTVAGSAINFGLCLLPIFIEPIYAIWTRGKLSFDFPLFSLLVVSVALRTFGHPALAFLQATNALTPQARITFVRAALAVSLTLALIHPFGLFGVGAALAISELIATAILPAWYAMRDFSLNAATFPVSRMIYSAGSVIIVGLAYAGCLRFFTLRLAICSLSSIGIVILGIIQWTMLHGETRRRVLSVLPVVLFRRCSCRGVSNPLVKKNRATR